MKRAYNIDDKTGTEFWRNSVAKEILKVNMAYIEKEDTTKQIPSGEAKG